MSNQNLTKVTPIGINEPKYNKSFEVRALLFLLRKIFSLRNLPLKIVILTLQLWTLKVFPVSKAVHYTIKQNLFFLWSLRALATKNPGKYLKIKKAWISFILHENLDPREVIAAEAYSKLLAEAEKNNWISNSGASRPLSGNIRKSISRSIYLYGPNAISLPDNRKSNCELWLTKMPTFDVANFAIKRLFLNDFTWRKLSRTQAELLIKEFTQIYVSSAKLISHPDILTLTTHNCGHIASPMSLARILHFAFSTTANERIFIEGFDQYMDQNAYSGNIVTFISSTDKTIANKQICVSLAHHDPLFNFLLVKKEIDKNRSSVTFGKELGVQKCALDYLAALCSHKNFSSIC